MSDAVRESIRHVLAETPVQALPGGTPLAPEKNMVKAGILPYLPAAATKNWQFLLMQPVAMHPDRGPPKFQMAKGTRMQRTGNAWQDIEGAASGETEPLIITALREGIEELGLDISRISALFDAGPVKFISAKTGTEKLMWLFAAKMQGADCLLPDVAPTTGNRLWLDWATMRTHARPDHAAIIQAVLPELQNHL